MGPPVAVGPGKKFRVYHPLSGPDKTHSTIHLEVGDLFTMTDRNM